MSYERIGGGTIKIDHYRKKPFMTQVKEFFLGLWYMFLGFLFICFLIGIFSDDKSDNKSASIKPPVRVQAVLHQ